MICLLTTDLYTLSLHDALPIFHQIALMIKSKQQVSSSSSSVLFAITLVSTLLVLGTVFSLQVLTPTSPFSSLLDRKSIRLNSSHVKISYAVFCLKKKRCMTVSS